MNNWKKCKLGDICSKITDGSHKSPPSQTSGFPMASVKDMEYNQINLNTCRKISKEDYLELVASGCQPEINDILIAKDGSYLKHVFRVRKKEELVLLSSIAIIRPILEQVCPQFLTYVFKNKRFIEEIEANYVTGAVIPRIVLRDFKEIEITLPPLEEQRQIAAILSSIDDKIELLHEQNKTLEELAQTLFRHYFIENPTLSWQNVKIKELASITSGKSLKRLDMQDDGENPILGANGIIGFTNKYLYDEPLLYTGRVGTLGKVFMINSAKKVWLSDNTLIIKPSSNFYFMYFVLKTSSLENLDVGSTQPLIRQSDLGEIEILLADDLLLEKFDITAKKIFDKIDKNLEQIQTLENMRDILIPKLLNGEIRSK